MQAEFGCPIRCEQQQKDERTREPNDQTLWLTVTKPPHCLESLGSVVCQWTGGLVQPLRDHGWLKPLCQEMDARWNVASSTFAASLSNILKGDGLSYHLFVLFPLNCLTVFTLYILLMVEW